MTIRQCTKVVLVPGIMGSELRLDDIDSFRMPRRRLIWGEDLNVIWQSLAERPEDFSSAKVKPGRILRYLTGFPFPIIRRLKFPVYGPLLEHLAERYNFREGEDLLEFGYDWRACNIKSSRALAQFLQQKTDESDRVTLIAHSMGGLVCRAFLANREFEYLHPRVHKVITMGAPVLGSPKAFYTLKKAPKIHRLFDYALKKRQKKDLVLYNQLMGALATFQSLYQMLPPTTEQVVFDLSGAHYSALHEDLWASHAGPLLKGAEELHGLLTGLSSDKLFALYSTQVKTEGAYVIDDNKRVKEAFQPYMRGDGTVTIASASAATVADNRISFASISHDSLPTSPEVWRSLEVLL